MIITKGHNCVVNLEKKKTNKKKKKKTRSHPKQDLVNAYAKLDQIPSVCLQDIEWKRNFDNN